MCILQTASKGLNFKLELSGRSNWSYLSKGAPQGSHFGAFIYNVLSNDMCYVITDQCDTFNYADDNSNCFLFGSNIDDVITNLGKVSDVMST